MLLRTKKSLILSTKKENNQETIPYIKKRKKGEEVKT